MASTFYLASASAWDVSQQAVGGAFRLQMRVLPCCPGGLGRCRDRVTDRSIVLAAGRNYRREGGAGSRKRARGRVVICYWFVRDVR